MANVIAVDVTTNNVTFLDLPTEIRNQIYNLLLPGDLSSRSSSQRRKTSTSFMAACKQIYHEAVSILYGKKTFSIDVHSEGGVVTISYLDKRERFGELSRDSFCWLGRVEALRLYITAGCGRDVCDVQDALFTVFDGLKPNHKLKKMEIRIDVSSLTMEEYYQGFEDLTRNYLQRKSNEPPPPKPTTTVFRGHIAAFLTDPIRTIRNFGDADKRNGLMLHFGGRAGGSWRKMKEDVKQLIHSNDLVPNYKPFCQYFKVLRELRLKLADLREQRFGDCWDDALLIGSRVRGDVLALRHHHFALITSIEELCSEQIAKLEKTNDLSASRVREYFGNVSDAKVAEVRKMLKTTPKEDVVDSLRKERMDLITKVHSLSHQLTNVLPDGDTDTSFFAYSQVDEMLREWKRAGNLC